MRLYCFSLYTAGEIAGLLQIWLNQFSVHRHVSSMLILHWHSHGLYEVRSLERRERSFIALIQYFSLAFGFGAWSMNNARACELTNINTRGAYSQTRINWNQAQLQTKHILKVYWTPDRLTKLRFNKEQIAGHWSIRNSQGLIFKSIDIIS